MKTPPSVCRRSGAKEVHFFVQAYLGEDLAQSSCWIRNCLASKMGYSWYREVVGRWEQSIVPYVWYHNLWNLFPRYATLRCSANTDDKNMPSLVRDSIPCLCFIKQYPHFIRLVGVVPFTTLKTCFSLLFVKHTWNQKWMFVGLLAKLWAARTSAGQELAHQRVTLSSIRCLLTLHQCTTKKNID